MAARMEATRSAGAEKFWSDSEAYCAKSKTLRVREKRYSIVTSKTRNFFEAPLASIGQSHSREVLLVDPSESPALNRRYSELLLLLNRLPHSRMNEIDILNTVNDFVQFKIFFQNYSRAEKMISCYQDSPHAQTVLVSGKKVVCIPIDRFIEIGSGFCRHQALVTAHLVDRLKREGKLPLSGEVRQVRLTLGASAHTWCHYITKDCAMLLDPMRKFFSAEIRNRGARELLGRLYGKKAACFMQDFTSKISSRLASGEAESPEKNKPLVPRELTWEEARTNRHDLFNRFGSFMKAMGVRQRIYNQAAEALGRALFASGPLKTEKLESYLKKVEHYLFSESNPDLAKISSQSERDLVLSLLVKFLRHECWTTAIRKEGLKQVKPQESKIATYLELLIDGFEEGVFYKEAFDGLPETLQKELCKRHHLLEERASASSSLESSFGDLSGGEKGKRQILAIRRYLLDYCRDLLKMGRESEAFALLELLGEDFKKETLHQKMWEVCGAPLEISSFGQKAFHGELTEYKGMDLKRKRIEALSLAIKELGLPS